MKRIRFLVFGLTAIVVIAVVATAVALAEASDGGNAGSSTFAITAGNVVDRASFSSADQQMLGRIGETGPIDKIGARGGRTFYKGTSADGDLCFMEGSFENGGGLSGGCLNSTALSQPLVDMSGVCIDPTTGAGRLDRVEGFAADGVSAVGVVDDKGAMHVTPVVTNIYQMSPADFPAGSRCPGFRSTAIVALDSQGQIISSIPVVVH